MPPAPASDRPPAYAAVTSARAKLVVALAASIVGGTVAALAGAGRAAPLTGL